MKRPGSFRTIRTTKAYDDFLRALYLGVRQRVEEIAVPAVQVISVTGNQPPATKPYQEAIAVLYGIGYGLKMGLKFGTLPRPAGHFDYRVGALETLWWSVGGQFEITNPETLCWQAFLMVPAFVTRKLVDEARRIAKNRHPELPYETATLTAIDDGHSVQTLHVGPYDREQSTLDALHAYMADHGLVLTGKHHEIYISDPRRTRPEKLKTVIRLAVKPASAARRK